MPDDASSSLPSTARSTLDRGALERVLTRAAELQAHSVEPSEGMSEQDLIELGGEVGIGADFVRRALAEERTRVDVPAAATRGVVAEWFGASQVGAARIVRGSPGTLLATLDEWMQSHESLQPKRRHGDRLTWEPRRDFLGNLQRGLNFRGRAYALVLAAETAATAAPVDAQRSLVRLHADMWAGRRRSAVGAGVAAGGGVAAGAGVLAIASLIPEGSLLVGGLVGSFWGGLGALGAAAVARAQRRKVERVHLALEQILDRLERNEIKPAAPSLLDLLVPRSR
ncbi:MAG: hypothetical protein ACT4R6_07220 [Gemmatimonadaceae bacterium]